MLFVLLKLFVRRLSNEDAGILGLTGGWPVLRSYRLSEKLLAKKVWVILELRELSKES